MLCVVLIFFVNKKLNKKIEEDDRKINEYLSRQVNNLQNMLQEYFVRRTFVKENMNFSDAQFCKDHSWEEIELTIEKTLEYGPDELSNLKLNLISSPNEEEVLRREEEIKDLELSIEFCENVSLDLLKKEWEDFRKKHSLLKKVVENRN